MSDWLDILAAQPTDGQRVYIRLTRFSPPTLMYWRADSLTFSNTGGDLTVAGAGTAGANGQYYGSNIPQPNYGYAKRDGSYFLFLDSGNANWCLGNSPFVTGGDEYYFTPNTANILGPYSHTLGAAPDPTVTMSLVFPAWAVARWRPYP